jgi:hypothetical protein
MSVNLGVMTGRRAGRIAARAGAGLVLCAASVLAAVLTSAPAEAGCHGGPSTAYVVSDYIIVGENAWLTGQERVQTTATCNSDSVYHGKVRDAGDGDGYCAYVVQRDPTAAVQQSQCVYGPWKNFTSWDQQGNSNAYYDVCHTWNCSEGYENNHNYGF